MYLAASKKRRFYDWKNTHVLGSVVGNCRYLYLCSVYQKIHSKNGTPYIMVPVLGYFADWDISVFYFPNGNGLQKRICDHLHHHRTA